MREAREAGKGTRACPKSAPHTLQPPAPHLRDHSANHITCHRLHTLPTPCPQPLCRTLRLPAPHLLDHRARCVAPSKAEPTITLTGVAVAAVVGAHLEGGWR